MQGMNGIWVGRLDESDGDVGLTPHGTVTGTISAKTGRKPPSSARSCR